MCRGLHLTIVCLAALVSALASGGAGAARQSKGNASPAPVLPNAVPSKRALLIAAWDYPEGGEFPSLRGDAPGKSAPENDAAGVRAELVRLGFGDVTVLSTRAQTSRKAILDAFAALAGRTRPGDVVFVQYSGHGSQLPDRDLPGNPNRPSSAAPAEPDEPDEPDGLDETLVPTDYGRNGAGELRDDLVNKLIDDILDRKPDNLTLVFDSCHSGTATRGDGVPRGASWAERKWEGGKPPLRARGREESASGLFGRGSARARGFFAISAAEEGELAWQALDDDKGVEMGRLSSALVTALSQADSGTTYQDLFQRVRGLMAQRYTNQHPQFEGDDRHILFGGRGLNASRFIPVTLDAQGRISLGRGRLQGMTEGSVVALYTAQDGPGKSAPLARATVVRVGLTESELDLPPAAAQALTQAITKSGVVRAFEESHAYGDMRLRVFYEGAPAAGDRVAATLRSLGFVHPDIGDGRGWDLSLRRVTAAERARGISSEYLLVNKTGAVVAEVAPGEAGARAVADALGREYKWRYAKALAQNSPSPVSVKMRVVKVEVTRKREGDTTYFEIARGGAAEEAPAELTVGKDFVVVDVMNTGDRPAFVTLLDLASDGEVSQLWPDAEHPVSDNFIPPADPAKPEAANWHRLWVGGKSNPYIIEIVEPTGPEFFKLIATSERVDFRSLETGRRGPENPVERFLRDALIDTRGATMAGASAPPAALWYTAEFPFTAVR